MTIEQIKRFRQLGSITAGHPEYGHTPGVETTTGPLGQGLANAVGMAIAERHLAAEFGDDVVDHKTYVLASDGDLMEGISQEAIALAGHLKLNRLIVLFDDNGISIDGALSLADSVDQVKRFEAAGWAASRIDGHDPAAIAAALEKAQASDKPVHDRLQDHHRLRRADQGRHSRRRTARRSAPTRSRARARSSAGPHAPFEVPADILDRLAQGRRALEGRARRLEQAPRRARCRQARRIRAPHERRSAEAALADAVRAVKEKLAADAEGDRHPHGLRIRAREPDPGAAGNDRRLGRPHRLQQHPHQVDEGDDRPPTIPAASSITASASTAWPPP